MINFIKRILGLNEVKYRISKIGDRDIIYCDVSNVNANQAEKFIADLKRYYVKN